MRWSIVIRKPSGSYIRETQMFCPDEDDLDYFERVHGEESEELLTRATVINIFEVKE